MLPSTHTRKKRKFLWKKESVDEILDWMDMNCLQAIRSVTKEIAESIKAAFFKNEEQVTVVVIQTKFQNLRKQYKAAGEILSGVRQPPTEQNLSLKDAALRECPHYFKMLQLNQRFENQLKTQESHSRMLRQQHQNQQQHPQPPFYNSGPHHHHHPPPPPPHHPNHYPPHNPQMEYPSNMPPMPYNPPMHSMPYPSNMPPQQQLPPPPPHMSQQQLPPQNMPHHHHHITPSPPPTHPQHMLPPPPPPPHQQQAPLPPPPHHQLPPPPGYDQRPIPRNESSYHLPPPYSQSYSNNSIPASATTLLNAARTLISPPSQQQQQQQQQQKHSPITSPRGSSYKDNDDEGINNRKRSLEQTSRPQNGTSPRLAISSILNNEGATSSNRLSSMDHLDDEISKRSRRRISETGQYQSSQSPYYNNSTTSNGTTPPTLANSSIFRSSSESSLTHRPSLPSLPPLRASPMLDQTPKNNFSRNSPPSSHASPSFQRNYISSSSSSYHSVRDSIQLPPIGSSGDQQFNRNYNYNQTHHSHSTSISNPASINNNNDTEKSTISTLLKTVSSLQSEVDKLRQELVTKKSPSPVLNNATPPKEQDEEEMKKESHHSSSPTIKAEEKKSPISESVALPPIKSSFPLDSEKTDEPKGSLRSIIQACAMQPRTTGSYSSSTSTTPVLSSTKQMEKPTSSPQSCSIETASPKNGKSELVST